MQKYTFMSPLGELFFLLRQRFIHSIIYMIYKGKHYILSQWFVFFMAFGVYVQ